MFAFWESVYLRQFLIKEEAAATFFQGKRFYEF
jgi:hypothetical protein